MGERDGEGNKIKKKGIRITKAQTLPSFLIRHKALKHKMYIQPSAAGGLPRLKSRWPRGGSARSVYSLRVFKNEKLAIQIGKISHFPLDANHKRSNSVDCFRFEPYGKFILKTDQGLPSFFGCFRFKGIVRDKQQQEKKLNI